MANPKGINQYTSSGASFSNGKGDWRKKGTFSRSSAKASPELLKSGKQLVSRMDKVLAKKKAK